MWGSYGWPPLDADATMGMAIVPRLRPPLRAVPLDGVRPRGRLRESREPASGTTRDVSRGVSDNDRKYYLIERAREVLGYDPQDNSAEWDGDERDA